MIMMIYRDEVYDKNTTRKGIADIIIAKQRNGEIGDVSADVPGQVHAVRELRARDRLREGVLSDRRHPVVTDRRSGSAEQPRSSPPLAPGCARHRGRQSQCLWARPRPRRARACRRGCVRVSRVSRKGSRCEPRASRIRSCARRCVRRRAARGCGRARSASSSCIRSSRSRCWSSSRAAPLRGLVENRHRHEPARLPAGGFRGGAFARLRALRGGWRAALLTHLACAENAAAWKRNCSSSAFDALSGPLRLERSIANSAGIIAWPDAHADWVRPGLDALWRFAVRRAQRRRPRVAAGDDVGEQVIAVRNVAAGEAVGYNGDLAREAPFTHRGRRGGYGDGFPRCMHAGRAGVDQRHARRRSSGASRWT